MGWKSWREKFWMMKQYRISSTPPCDRSTTLPSVEQSTVFSPVALQSNANPPFKRKVFKVEQKSRKEGKIERQTLSYERRRWIIQIYQLFCELCHWWVRLTILIEFSVCKCCNPNYAVKARSFMHLEPKRVSTSGW